jgi:hypothetical protein
VRSGLSTIFPNTFSGEINYEKREDIIKKKQNTKTANFNIDKLGELIEDLVKEDFANYFDVEPDVVIRSFVNCKYNINATYFDLEAGVYEGIKESIESGRNPNPFHKNIKQGNDMRQVQFATEKTENPNAKAQPSRFFTPQGVPPISELQQQFNPTFQNLDMRRPQQQRMPERDRLQSSSNYPSDDDPLSQQRFDQSSRPIEQRGDLLLQQMRQPVDQLSQQQFYQPSGPIEQRGDPLSQPIPRERETPKHDQSKLKRLQRDFPKVGTGVLIAALNETENDYNKAHARIMQRRRGSSGGQYYRKRKTRKPRKIRKPRKTRKN